MVNGSGKFATYFSLLQVNYDLILYCSCEYNCHSFDEQLLSSPVSNIDDFHQYGEDGLVLSP